jgi:predicted NBD/HSP70 family sugar kinase/mannose-6-phosphate isomerase class I
MAIMSEHMNKRVVLGVDVGGSHISAALIDATTGAVLNDSVSRAVVQANDKKEVILEQWAAVLENLLKQSNGHELCGMGIAMPGPFDYSNGVALMKGLGKYDQLYGLDVGRELRQKLALADHLPLLFENDAACFGVGECLASGMEKFNRIIALTLGTGFGATFLQNGVVVRKGEGVPPNGELYNVRYKEGICEDYISGRWIASRYAELSRNEALPAMEVAKQALHNHAPAVQVFTEFGQHLAACLSSWVASFQPDCIVIGGNIARSSALFLSSFQEALSNQGLCPFIRISHDMEKAAIRGAASLVISRQNAAAKNKETPRTSSQALLSQQTVERDLQAGDYDMYPFFPIGAGKINSGFESLAEWIVTQKDVAIDGMPGNDWIAVEQQLSACFEEKGLRVRWYRTEDFRLQPNEIDALIAPFVSEPGEVWGTRTTLEMKDFFRVPEIPVLPETREADLHLVIGVGAALADWPSLIYLDLPKNEIQYRMRAGAEVSLALTRGLSNPEVYKRLYFVDWVVSRKHRENIQNRIDVIGDAQWPSTLSWSLAKEVFEGLRNMSQSVVRARPWFEPGAWGGEWLKQHIKGINTQVVNYAWSFELIVPENGLVLESDGLQLEVAFDWLMDRHAESVLGSDAQRFGAEFPIRFDYLDTVVGGNLSIQCHPSTDYIRQQFGENFTQDETYYILDCTEGAQVYLGFQESINPQQFRKELEDSVSQNVPVNITDHVQVHPAQKHDLFLIPNQTIHSAGKNNLVLEISATPYIFTFKMYDWLRLDLEGNPRPINIEHAFHNLDFSRKGQKVTEELISKPLVIADDGDHQIVHLPTHREHFYDVHRHEFTDAIRIETKGKCFVMMLVEGVAIDITVDGGRTVRMNYAETFVVPAAANAITVQNQGTAKAKLIKAFVK